MLVLFPSDPFETKKPDPDWAEEAKIAESLGHQVAYIHWESLVQDGDATKAILQVPDFAEPVPAIYRGWMLTSDQYEQLYEKLQVCAIDLLNTPNQYRKTHELPGWYLDLEGYTPMSVTIPKDEVTMARLLEEAKNLLEGDDPCEHGIIVKDYVKSRKHEWEEACFIPDRTKAETVLANFLERQGDALQGGVVLRDFIPLKGLGKHPQSGMPMSIEFRFFWFNGHVIDVSEYWPSEFYEMETIYPPEPEGGWEPDMPRSFQVPKAVEELPNFEELGELAAKIDSMFFAMDLAQKKDGGWVIMEIGDGQVSGFPQPSCAEKFYSQLDPLLRHKHHRAPPKPMMALTQKDMDGMGCGHEDCDHTSHTTELVLHPKCHVGTPTWCSYDNGVIVVRCAECDQMVARIAVDPGTTERH